MAASSAECSFRSELVVSGLASPRRISRAAKGMHQQSGKSLSRSRVKECSRHSATPCPTHVCLQVASRKECSPLTTQQVPPETFHQVNAERIGTCVVRHDLIENRNLPQLNEGCTRGFSWLLHMSLCTTNTMWTPRNATWTTSYIKRAPETMSNTM